MADIIRNESSSQWQAVESGEVVGHLEYHDGPGMVSLIHTEVDGAYGGRGLAGQLVQTALDDVRASGKQVRPVCPYVVRWIDRNPDYADLVHPEWS